MNPKELLASYTAGHRKFDLANLRGVNLVGAQLGGINLQRANLTEANLTRANLCGASLVKANLTRANLRGANLKGADLRQANLTGAEVNLEALEPASYAGAILPDGCRTEMELPAAMTSAAPPARGVEAAPESEPVSPPVSPRHFPAPTATSQGLWRQLPWLRLVAWGSGYGFLGLFLFCLGAGPLAWMLVWASALAGVWQPVLLPLLPLVAAVAVVLGTGLSWLGLGLGLALVVVLVLGLKLTGWRWQRSVELGLWFGGAGCLVVAIAPLLLSQQAALGKTVIATALAGRSSTIAATPPLALMLLVGMGLLAAGTPTLRRLQQLHLSTTAAAASVGVAAFLGLLLGSGMGWLAMGLT